MFYFNLDMCASPGGKTITILQTLLPSKLSNMKCISIKTAKWLFKEKVVALDITFSRLERLNRTLNYFNPKNILDEHVETYLNMPTTNPYYSCEEKFNKVYYEDKCR